MGCLVSFHYSEMPGRINFKQLYLIVQLLSRSIVFLFLVKVPVGNNPKETEHTVYLTTKKQREKPLRPLNPFQGMPQRPKKTPTS